MKFPFIECIVPSDDLDDFLVLGRPVIPLKLVSADRWASSEALVDTGSDRTLIPMSVATTLGLPLSTATVVPLTSFTGQGVEAPVCNAVFELTDGTEVLRWRTQAACFPFEQSQDEIVILGMRGFLEFFTATFDSENGVLELVTNGFFSEAEVP